MTTAKIRLSAPHGGQQRVMAEARRFNVLACGRRWGKTELGGQLSVGPALHSYPTGYFAPNYKDLMNVWREIKRTLYDVTVRKNETEKRIELTTGGSIEFWTLDNPDAGRGRKYKRLIVDEAAKAAHLQLWWTEAGRPTLTDYRGDAWFLSTPKGRNYFYRLFNMGMVEEDWAAWQMPTSTNPYIDPGEIEDARRHLPQAAFLQEYMAEFTEDAGLVFRNVRGCLAPDVPDGPEEGHRYVMGVDWAQAHDWTVLTVMDAQTRQVVDLDRFNQIAWEIQRARLAILAARWQVIGILAEANSIGGPNIEALQSEGLPVVAFMTTNESKQNVIIALQLAFERGEIGVPDDPVLIAELDAFEAKRLPSGRWRYEAPEGMTDDIVISLALALEACNTAYVVAGQQTPHQPFRFSSSSY